MCCWVQRITYSLFDNMSRTRNAVISSLEIYRRMSLDRAPRSKTIWASPSSMCNHVRGSPDKARGPHAARGRVILGSFVPVILINVKKYGKGNWPNCAYPVTLSLCVPMSLPTPPQAHYPSPEVLVAGVWLYVARRTESLRSLGVDVM